MLEPMVLILRVHGSGVASPTQGTGSTHTILISDAFPPHLAPYRQFISGPDHVTKSRPIIHANIITSTLHNNIQRELQAPSTFPPLHPIIQRKLYEHNSPSAYLSWFRKSTQHPILQTFRLGPTNTIITALISVNSPLPIHQTNIKLINLHKCTTQLSDHAAGLLTLCLAAHQLGSLYPQGITLHIHNSSSAKTYSNAHKPTNNSTNPYQLLLQISHQQQTRFPNLTIHIHPHSDANESNPQSQHYNKIPNKNAILSHQPKPYHCSNSL